MSAHRPALWALLLLCLLLSAGCCGCRDFVDFGVASSGLSRPSRTLDCLNKDRVLDRIRWLEMLRIWERYTGAHALSQSLGPVDASQQWRTCNPDCSAKGDTCCSCYKVDGCSNYVDLACYTGRSSGPTLTGALRLNMETVEQREGEGYVDWDKVCYPKAKATNPKVKGVCAEGFTAYQVRNDQTRLPNRNDTLWVVRVWIQEGADVQKLRLDGSVGMAFQERRDAAIPNVVRTAIFFDETSFVYSRFSIPPMSTTKDPDPLHVLKQNGSVHVLATNGEFKCCFQVDPTTGERRSSCKSVDQGQRLCTTGADLCP